MKKIIKNKEKMKNTMYIVFGVFALALFTITIANPSYASDGLIIDNALDAIAGEIIETNTLPQNENLQEIEEILENNHEDLDEMVENSNTQGKNFEAQEEDSQESLIEQENGNGLDNIDTNDENKEVEQILAEIPDGEFIEKEFKGIETKSVLKATLLNGDEFNRKIKNLVPGANATKRYTPDNDIENIKLATNIESIPQNAVLISGADSDFPVYAWYNDGDIFYYFTGTDRIYLNSNSMGIFAYFKALKTIDLDKFDTSLVTDMYGMFYNDEELLSVDLSKFNTESLEQMQYFMKGAKKIKNVDLSGFVTNKVIYMHDLFEGCTALETVNLDNRSLGGGNRLGNLGQGIFSSNPNLKYVSARNWKNLPNDISYGIEQFFDYDAITGALDLTDWDTSNITDMRYALYHMPVTEIIGLETWDTSNVENMNGMFKYMQGIKSLNLSGWDTSKVEDMKDMFEYSENIEEIIGLNTWDTSSVKRMGCMFHGCRKLKYINLDNWDLTNLNKISDGGSSMFSEANSLTGISARNWTAPKDLYNWIYYWTIYTTPVESIDVTNWNTSNVESMNFMFTDITTPIKIIGLETWDTSNVKSMRGMFTRSIGLTGLNLSNFDTRNLEDTYMMFQGASNLKTIYVGDNFTTNKVTNSENMFSGAVSLVGGKGTSFDENHIDKEYARADGENPGYFTKGEFNIKYNLDGGELDNKKTSYKIGESFTIVEPTKEEAIFMGRTGSNLDEPQLIIEITKGTSGDLEYTANWKINKYKIILDTDGGNEINSIEREYSGSLLDITLPTPVKECNDFSGWNTELPELMPAHDITLKAIWNYTCSRASGGGGSKKSEPTTSEVTNDITQEHNSADDKTTKPTSDTTTAPINEETTKEVISVTQEVADDGTQVEVVVEAVAIKNTNIVATVRTETPVNGVSSHTSSSSSTTHTQEQTDAYSFAKANGITTTESIETAKMNTELTRIQMAKMLSNFAINVLGEEPDVSKGTADFDDVTNKMDEQYDNAVTKAYQLGIMGQNVKDNEFRPNDEVSRAEFTASLSRLLYKTDEGEYKGTNKYYVPHIAKLYNEGIVNKADPKIKEKRGYVMTMLKRTVE